MASAERPKLLLTWRMLAASLISKGYAPSDVLETMATVGLHGGEDIARSVLSKHVDDFNPSQAPKMPKAAPWP